MTTTTRKSKDEHEAFKNRLVNDVFGKDNHGRVQMEKVMMLVWHFRDDPAVVQFMAQFVAKFSGSRDVFNGIEFYLPQLAHMIIHLEADWDDAVLERFALIIAQQSLHFALQFNWILNGAIEDYEPELPSGQPNPDHNPLFYSRCIKLLSNIERCVVYGRPRSLELQRLYEMGKITKKEYEILEQADRRYNAFQIISSNNSNRPNSIQQEEEDARLQAFGGELLYKRKVRRSCVKRKPWKKRYFSIEERMLHCYNYKGGTLIRSMPLEGAEVQETVTSRDRTNHKTYPHMFAVQNRNFRFVMRATSAEQKELWVTQLRDEAAAHALFLHGTDEDDNSRHLQVMEDLTPSQKMRFDFFRDEREFVRELCDIAEKLRFRDRTERKILAPSLMAELKIPPCVYLPLCNSTDIWRRVEQTVPKDTRVFNTKERCPVIMYFIGKRGENLKHRRGGMKDANLDVAEFLHSQFDARELLQSSSGMSMIEEEGELSESQHQSSADLPEGGKENEEEQEGAEDELDDDNGEASTRSSISAVWHDPHTMESQGSHRGSMKGNRQVQSFLRDNFVSIPRKLASRLESRRSIRSKSILDKTPGGLQTVPILETKSEDESESASVDGVEVAVHRGSIIAAGSIFLGDEHEGDIDMSAVENAKEIICHGESWTEKTARMLREFKEGEKEGVTEVVSLMAKSNDDLRQEMFVMQMIHYYKSVFASADLPLWLKTYNILSVSKDTGLIEVLTDATSIDGLKKSDGYPTEGGLRKYFENTYGAPDSTSFKAAQTNFMQSLAAYSLVSFFLGLKDRHNGNIMIDTLGRLIFIDFGFAMGMAPGHEFSFERAPFKLTNEYIEVMGGPDSECFAEFKRLFVAGFLESRKSSQIAIGLVEIMMYKSNYPCFSGFRYGGDIALKRFEKRLMLHVPDSQVKKKALRLISNSINNLGTSFYDRFQQWSNGYAM